MATSLYAVVSTGNSVINMALWDGASTWDTGTNSKVSATGQPNAQVGGTYVGGVFTAPSALPAAQGVMFLNSPVSGATLAIPLPPQPQAVIYVMLQPAGTLASLTLQLPANPQDGDQIYAWSSKTITSLTLTPAAGQAIINTATTLPANTSGHLTWSAQLSSWFRI